MIYTSYFANMRKMTDEQKNRCMSIARYTPRGVKIPINTMLAPKWDILKKYKEDNDMNDFARAYKEQLSALDPAKVAKTMDGRILVCYEKIGDFCHRHILARWLRDAGYECEELAL